MPNHAIAQTSRLAAAPPRPPVIPGVMTLKTLADVRSLLGHLPNDVRARATCNMWRPSWIMPRAEATP